MSILYGIIGIVAVLFIGWLYYSVKALKDPDVQAAADLRMSITRFHHYQKLYDEYDEFMRMHGANSAASERKFVEIFKQIDNPNEWRRYQEYRYQKAQEETMSEILKGYKTTKNIRTFKDADTFKPIFDFILQNGLEDMPKDIQDSLTDIITNKHREWEHYCMSRKSEYKPSYVAGYQFRAKNEDTDECVGAKIEAIKFDHIWWRYEVLFSEAVSVNNCWPDEKLLLTDQQIRDLSSQKILCSNTHYIF